MSEEHHARHSNRTSSKGSLAETRAAEDELRMNDLNYRTAAHPHQMCVDTNIKAEAYRVWGVMDFLITNHIAPEPAVIASMLNVGKRSVERWIAALDAAHWISWNKNATDPARRYMLRQSNNDDERKLAAIRALYAAGGVSVEAIRAILENVDENADENVTDGNSVRNGNIAKNGKSDTVGKSNDRTIIAFAKNDKTDDRTIIRFDTPIISDSSAPQQDAVNTASPPHDDDGVLSSKKESPTASRNHAQTSAPSPTVAEVWLRAEGVSKKKARQFRDFDTHAVEYEWRAEIAPRGSVPEVKRQYLIGRLLDRWEIRPPALPPPQLPPAEQHYVADEAPEYAQARALLPLGTPLELHYLYLLLEGGATTADALQHVQAADHRAITLALAQLTHGGAP